MQRCTHRQFARSLFALFAFMVAGGTFATRLSGQDPVAIEREVQQLFELRCVECHGRDLPANKRKGNKQMFLDARSARAELELLKVLVVGNPADSTLVQKVVENSEDHRMPPKGDRLSETQVALLRQWIAGNAPGAVNGPPTTALKRGDLFKSVYEDLQSASSDDRPHLRYLSLHNLRNAGDEPAALQAYRAGVSKALNSLSTEAQISVPAALGPDRVLLRLDLRAYGWDKDKWDLLAAAYPYDIEPTVLTRVEKETRQMTGTVVPIIRADWFVFAATQPPFYEKLLTAPGYPGGLPNSDARLEQQLGIHTLENIRNGRVQRAAFTDSGVSESNRMIERHGLARGGYYWKSYDFANERGSGDLVRNPLGPLGAGFRAAFQHDGGEIIWSLPNGLQGYLLSNAKGNVVARAPTGIVKDPLGPQGAVINGISCMHCHSAGMRQPKGAEANVGSTHTRARRALDPTDQRIFDRLYQDASSIARLVNEDGDRFKVAARRAGVTEATWFTQEEEPVFRLYARFRAEITARTLAAELDMDPAEVASRLRDYDGAGDAQMNSLLQRLPKGIKRQNFIEDFAALSLVFERGRARSFRPVIFEEFRETTGPEALAAETGAQASQENLRALAEQKARAAEAAKQRAAELELNRLAAEKAKQAEAQARAEADAKRLADSRAAFLERVRIDSEARENFRRTGVLQPTVRTFAPPNLPLRESNAFVPRSSGTSSAFSLPVEPDDPVEASRQRLLNRYRQQQLRNFQR